jgi:hypothetical protein
VTALHAYADESERPARYLMSCLVVAPAEVPRLREATRRLLLPGQRRLHFHSESDHRQRRLASELVHFEADVTVFICRSTHGRRGREARASCLTAIVDHLQETGSDVMLTLESRHEQDREDHPVIWSARRRHPLLDYQHVRGGEEPMLWLADAFAWLVGAGGAWQRRIAPAVTQVIDVS